MPDHSDTSSASEAARIRQTLESIVVAFILAFVFRAFVIEAFVIPTGSMAATLYGEHMTFVCPDCGYEFAYGWSGQDRTHGRIVCPLCQYEIIGRARVEGGDRILVFKFPYDMGGTWLHPRRWDVCVFKNPGDGQTNFIKRLAGLPEEVIEIIDGDLYAAPAARVSPTILNVLSRPPWDRPRLTPEQRAELDEALKICTKTQAAQHSLWFTFYDEDYPTTLPRSVDQPPDWTPLGPQSAWRVHERQLSFDGGGRRLDQIEFTGKKVTDFYAYNGEQFERRRMVSDLRASAVLIPHGPGGRFEIRLTKQDELFQLVLEMDGSVELNRLRLHESEPPEQIDTRQARIEPLQPGLAYEVALSNVDHVARVEVEDQVLLSMPWPGDPATARERAVSRDEPRILLAAAESRLTLRHVRLQRDVFYRSPLIEEDHDEEASRNPYIRHPGWATTNQPMYLRRGEYFVLGDNSPESKDSRLWWHACDLLEPAGPLRRLITLQGSTLARNVPLGDAQVQQVRERIAGLRYSLERAPAYRQPELKQAADRLKSTLVDSYIPLAQTDPPQALTLEAQLARLLAEVDWHYYHLGTVPADQMIGRAFFVYWPAGVAPLRDTGGRFANSLRRGGLLGRLAYKLLYGGIVPNVGQMRFVR